MYSIDLLVFHWDTDHYQEDIITLNFVSLEKAKEAKKYLNALPFEAHWDNRKPNSYGFCERDLDEQGDWVLLKTGIWGGGIFKTTFIIYIETRKRTIVG